MSDLTWDHELSRWVPAYRQTRWDQAAAEATASTSLDQPGTGAGYTAVEPHEALSGESLDDALLAADIWGGQLPLRDLRTFIEAFLTSPHVAALIRAAEQRGAEKATGDLLRQADLATGSWVLGDLVGLVHTTLVGTAHDLDHPDCEDSTIAHLTEWRLAWIARSGR